VNGGSRPSFDFYVAHREIGSQNNYCGFEIATSKFYAMSSAMSDNNRVLGTMG
jgi:hypothetical protein